MIPPKSATALTKVAKTRETKARNKQKREAQALATRVILEAQDY